MRFLISDSPQLCMSVASHANPTNIQINTWIKTCAQVWSVYLIQRVKIYGQMSCDNFWACFVDFITFWTMQLDIHFLKSVPDHPKQLMGRVNWRKRMR